MASITQCEYNTIIIFLYFLYDNPNITQYGEYDNNNPNITQYGEYDNNNPNITQYGEYDIQLFVIFVYNTNIIHRIINIR